MFENVNGRTTGGRTPDPWVSYKLTGEPSAQVSSNTCVPNEVLSLKGSLTRVFTVRYMDILFVRPNITVSR